MEMIVTNEMLKDKDPVGNMVGTLSLMIYNNNQPKKLKPSQRFNTEKNEFVKKIIKKACDHPLKYLPTPNTSSNTKTLTKNAYSSLTKNLKGFFSHCATKDNRGYLIKKWEKVSKDDYEKYMFPFYINLNKELETFFSHCTKNYKRSFINEWDSANKNDYEKFINSFYNYYKIENKELKKICREKMFSIGSDLAIYGMYELDLKLSQQLKTKS